MNKKFTIECEMEERWINYFLSFLKELEYNGKIGHSELVGFFSDGDGDFRPTFKTDIDYTKTKSLISVSKEIKFFDAG